MAASVLATGAAGAAADPLTLDANKKLQALSLILQQSLLTWLWEKYLSANVLLMGLIKLTMAVPSFSLVRN